MRRAVRLYGIDLGFQNADVRQIAVFFIVIQPVADDELVRHREADVIRLQVNLAAAGFIQQRGDADGARPPALQQLLDIAEREAGVQDILNDQNILACKGTSRSFTIFTTPLDLTPEP